MSQLLSILKLIAKYLLISILVFFYCALYIVIVVPIYFFYILESNQNTGDRVQHVLGYDTCKRRKEKKESNEYLLQATKPLKKIFLLLLSLLKKW